MSILAFILIFTLIGSIASLIGGVLLLLNQNLCKKLTPFFVAFAAGSLLTVALIDLIPEAIEKSLEEPRRVLLAVLIGIVVFFFIERYVFWFHHHHEREDEPNPTTTLIIVGDTLHNFLDGIAIAASFLISIPIGIATSIAVGLHEIPQEIGDFAALLALGMKRNKVFLVNLLSAFASLFGALLGFYFFSLVENVLPYLLAFTGGNFIYIAASDLIPEIHTEYQSKKATNQALLFVFGIILTYIVINAL